MEKKVIGVPYKVAIQFIFPGFLLLNAILVCFELFKIHVYNNTMIILNSDIFAFIISEIILSFVIGYFFSEIFAHKFKPFDGNIYEFYSGSQKFANRVINYIHKELIRIVFSRQAKIHEKLLDFLRKRGIQIIKNAFFILLYKFYLRVLQFVFITIIPLDKFTAKQFSQKKRE